MNDNPGFPPARGVSPRCNSAAWRGYSIFFGGICRRRTADRIRTRLRVWAEPRWRWRQQGFGSPRPRRRLRLLWDRERPNSSSPTSISRALLWRAAALELLQLAQRSIGLQAFMRPNPIERISRDLATYLRGPGPDRALTDAASWILALPVDAQDLLR
jgi:hypothetical protein